jgi:hypothetical protein
LTVFLASEICHWTPRWFLAWRSADCALLVFEAAKSDFEDFFDESSSPHAPDDAFNPRLLVVVVVVVFVQNFVVPASNTSTCVPPWYIENIVVVFVQKSVRKC